MTHPGVKAGIYRLKTHAAITTLERVSIPPVGLVRWSKKVNGMRHAYTYLRDKTNGGV